LYDTTCFIGPFAEVATSKISGLDSSGPRFEWWLQLSKAFVPEMDTVESLLQVVKENHSGSLEQDDATGPDFYSEGEFKTPLSPHCHSRDDLPPFS
jgi:hypothetical protein